MSEWRRDAKSKIAHPLNNQLDGEWVMGGWNHAPLVCSDNTSVEACCDWNVQIKKHVCFSSRTSMSICYRGAPLFISVSRDLSPAIACQATSYPHASMHCGSPQLMQNDLFIHLFANSTFHTSWANETRSIPARFVGCDVLPSNLNTHTIPSYWGVENKMQMLRITWPV